VRRKTHTPGRHAALRRLALACTCAGLAASWPGAAATRSPRNANYTIEARLDPQSRTIAGRAVLEWRNLEAQPTDELWFHLYWNAWRNSRSTWMLENALGPRRGVRHEPRKEDWGWIEVDSIRLLEAGRRKGRELERQFAVPDDGNLQDRTVLVADLPHAVASGETVRVEVIWRARVPRTFARTGYRGDDYFLGHWFPQLGVYEKQGWNCHQFHAATEFFSDYGVYDVQLTVPSGWVLGATGREVTRRNNGDGTTTHRYRAEDVHGFAWTVSPHFVVREQRFEEPGLPAADLRLLLQPEHRGQAERYFHAAAAALRLYGTWYGPYPYGTLTIVDPAHDSGTEGMEYATLFTGGTRRFSPRGTDRPESVTVHETGHQFWYLLVGSNEFEHAWLDEGLDTFSTIRVMDETYEPRILEQRYLNEFVPVLFHDIEVPRWLSRLDRNREVATAELPSTPSYLYHPSFGRSATYDRTALWLMTLERHLGQETLREILSTFFERYRFRHPRPEDFFAVANQVAGRDLTWFFDQVHRSAADFDYGIEEIRTQPADLVGWSLVDGEMVYFEAPDEEGAEEDRVYRTEVLARRHGSGRFPVEVLLVFEDGHEIRRVWNDDQPWKLFVAERAAKLEYAEVDPYRVLMLDLRPGNNALLREGRAGLPAIKWGSKWMVWLQDLLSTFAFFL
jgi:hypothetical protein